MIDDGLLLEIREHNLSYLLLAQKMLINDRASGMFRLGMSEEIAKLIETLTSKQLCQLSSTQQLLCRFSFSDAPQVEKLLDNHRAANLAHIHSSILLASSTNERVAE